MRAAINEHPVAYPCHPSFPWSFLRYFKLSTKRMFQPQMTQISRIEKRVVGKKWRQETKERAAMINRLIRSIRTRS